MEDSLMTSRTNNARPAMLIAALLVMVAAIAFNAQAASAQCCAIRINNLSGCGFDVCFEINGVDDCYRVASGVNIIDVPHCAPHRVIIYDACGQRFEFPSTIGSCIVVNTAPGCCVRICKTGDCRWEATSVLCLPCT
jgi:hypothetical protein